MCSSFASSYPLESLRCLSSMISNYVVILSPKCLYLIKHDLVTGVSTRGNLTEVDGHMITICGSRRTDCWEDSLEAILEKMCKRSGCFVVEEKPLSELNVQEILTEQVSPGEAAVVGLPMSRMSREKRGKRIE